MSIMKEDVVWETLAEKLRGRGWVEDRKHPGCMVSPHGGVALSRTSVEDVHAVERLCESLSRHYGRLSREYGTAAPVRQAEIHAHLEDVASVLSVFNRPLSWNDDGEVGTETEKAWPKIISELEKNGWESDGKVLRSPSGKCWWEFVPRGEVCMFYQYWDRKLRQVSSEEPKEVANDIDNLLEILFPFSQDSDAK